MSKSSWSPAELKRVRIEGGLLGERQRMILRRSIDQQYQQCKSTGRIDALKLQWKSGSDLPKPHEFWDSDIGKWIESAAYALMIEPNAELERRVDEVADLLEGAQQPDGYLNSHFSAVAPEKRFTNLRDQHELYCAGHLIEAAVAYFQATGKRKILDVLCRYVDCIDSTFGTEPGMKNGYDGHEEIELALIKLWKTTGDVKHLKLAKHFIDARGKQPHFFTQEAISRGDDPKKMWGGGYEYYQAHLPVREQSTVEGHSVRALYLFAGVADVAAATGDKPLLKACRRIFKNLTGRRMYITGGVGSTRHGERFTYDFDLPNESAYAETCASIALVFFAQRMMNIDRDGKYADAMETALYNGVLSGISLDGEKYFYANYLATDPKWHRLEGGYPAERQGWFGCACCPPNLARLIASIGMYVYSTGEDEIAVNLYANASATFELKGNRITLEQRTDYPWDETVRIKLSVAELKSFTLHLRIPGWCRKYKLKINGKKTNAKRFVKNGYASIIRTWRDGDRIELTLAMPPTRVYADPRVRHNTGRAAITRGPIVYCLEQSDNRAHLNAIVLPEKSKLRVNYESRLLGGVTTIRAKAAREKFNKGDKLYQERRPQTVGQSIKAIPYYAWANRGEGEMIVWIREG